MEQSGLFDRAYYKMLHRNDTKINKIRRRPFKGISNDNWYMDDGNRKKNKTNINNVKP